MAKRIHESMYIPFNIYIEYLRFIEKEDQCQGNQMHSKYNYEQVLGCISDNT